MINWNKYDNWSDTKYFKEGTIVRLDDGSFKVIGEINTSGGINDEFTEDSITHFTNDFIDDINSVINKAANSFND